MDSVPLVVITGQVSSSLIGKDVFQEADITGSTEPFTKHNYLIKSAADIPKTIKEAFFIASTGRPGPVLIDIPVDLQNMEIDFYYPSDVNIRGYKPKNIGHKFQIKKALEKILDSKRPLICVGGGVACSNSREEFRKFIEKSHIPVVHTLMGKDSIETTSPFYVGLIGSHGLTAANKSLLKADLLIFIGSRIGDRAAVSLKHLDDNVPIIHIDIDPAEIGKNLNPSIPLVGDANDVLSQLNHSIEPINTTEWLEEIATMKGSDVDTAIVKEHISSHGTVSPKQILNILSSTDDENMILVTDVGQNQIWSARNFSISGDRRFITSGGLGTMGYGLPAAIGAKLAAPERKVVITTGDGGFQMCLFELATLVQCKTNILIILFNNSGLGMVREIQRYSYNNTFGVDINCNPDFVKIAEAYGIEGKKITSEAEFISALDLFSSGNKSMLLECIVDPLEKTLV
jgi:acetolactate synthase-1/2/3 large subunit